MRTAKEMYYFAKQNHFGTGFNDNRGIKHFSVIEGALTPDETVKMVFIGLHNFKSLTNHDNNYAYAVTDKRIIMAQKKIIGQVCQSVYYNQLNDITMSTGMLTGIVTIDTTKEVFNVFVGKVEAQNVYSHLHRVIDEIRNPQQTQSARMQADMNSNMAALQYFKEMLDKGLITPQDFELKKRQILGL